MQFIFLLIILFLISCVLYGIAAGVRVIARGISSLTSNRSDAGESVIQPMLQALAPVADASSLHRSIGELRELFTLHQRGALTEEEFARMKQHLLVTISDDAPKNQ